MATIAIDKQEYELALETLKYYKEIIDTYEAIKIGEEEKKNGKIKKLKSLSSLI